MKRRTQAGEKTKPAEPDFYRQILDHLSDGVYIVDRQLRIQYWNEGACRLTGYTAEEMMGRSCEDTALCHVDYSGRKLCVENCHLAAAIADGRTQTVHVFLRHKQGRRVPVSARVQPICDRRGSIVGAVEVFSDDSAQSEALRRIEDMERMAFLDHLTQLPNRRFMEMSLRTALIESRERNHAFGLLMIDLDGFKAINDSFGHSCGDRALQQVAKTLAGALRPTDTVGRWGGDEFLAIVVNVNDEILGELARRCVELAGQTAIPSNDERTITLSISVGAALVHNRETARRLITRADKLMYRSKAAGRGRVTVERLDPQAPGRIRG